MRFRSQVGDKWPGWGVRGHGRCFLAKKLHNRSNSWDLIELLCGDAPCELACFMHFCELLKVRRKNLFLNHPKKVRKWAVGQHFHPFEISW